jgi:signal peptidase I
VHFFDFARAALLRRQSCVVKIVWDNLRTADEVNDSPEPSLGQRLVYGRNLHWTLVRVVIWIVVLLAGSQFVVRPVRVQGSSMLPTYRDGRMNLVFKWAYRFGEPARGDVVAIRLAGEHIMFLKRIIALPGETVGFYKGRVVINGEFLDEPYLKLPSNWTRAPVTLGSDEYFVVGDNRSMPKEDHEFGKAKRDRIVGKALL